MIRISDILSRSQMSELKRFYSFDTKNLLQALGVARVTTSPSGFYEILPIGAFFLEKLGSYLSRLAASKSILPISPSPFLPVRLMLQSNRYEKFQPDVFHLSGGHSDLLLSPSHEEYIVDMLARHGVRSFRDLPRSYYILGDVLRRLRHRSSRGFLFGGRIVCFGLYCVTADQNSKVAELLKYRLIFKEVFEKLDISVKPLLREKNFTDLVVDHCLGDSRMHACSNGHISQEHVAYCLECGEEVESKNVLSMAMYFDAGDIFSRAHGYYVNGTSGRIYPGLVTGGLGLMRTLFVLADRRRKGGGLRWPAGFAPIDIILTSEVDSGVTDVVRAVASKLGRSGVRVLMSEDCPPGVPILAMDLLGVPIHGNVFKLCAGSGYRVRLNKLEDASTWDQTMDEFVNWAKSESQIDFGL